MSTASAISSSSRQFPFLSCLLLFIVAALSSTSLASRPGHHLQIDPLAHVRVDPSQSVTMLGRHTFNATVTQDHVDHWIVLFCVDWLDHCQGLWHDYRRMAMHWERVLGPDASSWQTTAVRFAEVDCATDKPLCNENRVENYPSVIHFKRGKFAKEWEISEDATSLSGDISKWIRGELSTKLMREEPSQQGSSAQGGVTHLRELMALLSWKDPATAAAGHFVIIVAVVVFAWIVGTGLELELQAVLSTLGKEVKKPWSSGLLPELKEMPPPRTIVRSSMEL